MGTFRSSIAAAMLCSAFFVTAAHAAPDEWYTYRYDSSRTGAQPYASNLSDPAKVGTLEVGWAFPATFNGVGEFKASPIVVDDTVFIGSVNGYFYALDAATGGLKWQYPRAGDPALLGSCDPGGFSGGIGHYGIQSSATFAVIGGQRAVIFGAPDPGAEGGLGSARLFAFPLSADPNNPQPIWKSDVVAHVDGCTSQNLREHHERIAFSSPLVSGNKVYVGVHDTGYSPIQQGKVVAVDVNTGQIDKNFNFVGAGKPGDGTHGGGVWNALAADGTGVYFTTGNTHIPWCVYPYIPPNCPSPVEPEPSPNHGLSTIRVDKDTGNIIWSFQPVPFARDGDPDWAAGATVMSTSCGELIASVQKDGWSYAINASNGSMRWQFPPTGLGPTFLNAVHGDDDYRRPGAAWNDVFIVRTGGETVVSIGHVSNDYDKLHALNVCATTEQDRVRWIADIPNNMADNFHKSYSTPTVTGGIVFTGTNEDPIDHKGHLVVLGDPSVVPPVGWRCSNTDYLSQNCPAPYVLVPIPRLLASIAMPYGGSLASIHNEPALAKGRVFVATNPTPAFPNAGHVYMLEPEEDIATIIPAIFAPDILTITTEFVTITIEDN